MVADFGLREQIVGCTSFCVEPKGLARTARLVGGTKDPDLQAIRDLAPTHILVNEEENKPEHVRACTEIAETLVTFPRSPFDLPALLEEAGRFLDRSGVARRFASEAAQVLQAVKVAVHRRQAAGGAAKRRFLYYIWREPYMVAAEDTYISAMLELAGLENAAPKGTRYPELPISVARLASADLVLFSTEPYPFRKRDVERFQGEWPDVPEVLRADGQLFSWYGTMGIKALKELHRWVSGDEQELVRKF